MIIVHNIIINMIIVNNMVIYMIIIDMIYYHHLLLRIRSFENRNYEPIYKGTWRKEAYPQRVYEPLSSYTITDTISDKEKSNINLFTNLSDGYLGVPYNYDDHQLTEEWITAFKDKKGKRDVKASEDSRINIQVQKLVESLVGTIITIIL